MRSPLARGSRGDIFELADSVNDEDFDWAARVSVGLDRLVEDFSSRHRSPTTTAVSTARSMSASARG